MVNFLCCHCSDVGFFESVLRPDHVNFCARGAQDGLVFHTWTMKFSFVKLRGWLVFIQPTQVLRIFSHGVLRVLRAVPSAQLKPCADHEKTFIDEVLLCGVKDSS